MQSLQKKQQAAQQLREILSKDQSRTIEERVDHCKQLQHEEHQPLFAVLYSSIHKAAGDNSIAGLKHFLRPPVSRHDKNVQQVHVDDYDKNGMCALHIAAEKGAVDAIEYLIVVGNCNPDVVTSYGNTAMMYACKENQLGAIKMLFNLGAQLNIANRAGNTAFHMAAQGDHGDAAHLLVDMIGEHHRRRKDMLIEDVHEADQVTDDGKGLADIDPHATAWSRKKVADHPEAVQLLNQANRSSATPLHVACMNNAIRVARCFLQHHAQIDMPDGSGETALHKAGRGGFRELYEMLKVFGASETVSNQFGETPGDLLKDNPQY